MYTIKWGPAVSATAIALLALALCAAAWAFTYSTMIMPGLDDADIQAHIVAASPWVALIVGLPLFFVIGRWLGRRAGRDAIPTAFAFIGLIVAVEIVLIAIFAGSADPLTVIGVCALALLFKAGGAYIGARSALYG